MNPKSCGWWGLKPSSGAEDSTQHFCEFSDRPFFRGAQCSSSIMAFGFPPRWGLALSPRRDTGLEVWRCVDVCHETG